MVVDYHQPVLLEEVLKGLEVRPDSWYIDATLGDGGHSLEILRLGGKVLSIDVDPEAIERARQRLEDEGFGEEDFRIVKGNFRDLENLISQTETKFSGVLFDFGVSSLQLEASERGFSFGKEGPIDMRLDPGLSVKALDLVKGLNKGELYDLFSKLGEEKLARGVAEAIISSRGLIDTTKDLADVVSGVYRKYRVKSDIHPATRVFQALRIAVNDELNAIKEGLPKALDVIEKNGNIVVISFHSLEDRIVKDLFKEWEDQATGVVLTKKPIVPSTQEVERNPRSRSAKLRIFKKI